MNKSDYQLAITFSIFYLHIIGSRDLYETYAKSDLCYYIIFR